MSSDNNWIDPLYLNELLTNEEKAIKKTAKDFCSSELSSIVVKDNKKHFFDKKIYQKFGSLGFLGMTINGYGGANSSNVSLGSDSVGSIIIDSGTFIGKYIVGAWYP